MNTVVVLLRRSKRDLLYPRYVEDVMIQKEKNKSQLPQNQPLISSWFKNFGFCYVLFDRLAPVLSRAGACLLLGLVKF